MRINTETITFFKFVLVGAVFCILFDIFRASRKVRKTSEFVVCIQDIIYFVLIGIILVFVIVHNIDIGIRLYFFVGIAVGIGLYISIVGNYIRNIYIAIFKVEDRILQFIFIPLEIYKTIFKKEINILKKYVINYCKKISHMINFNHTKIKNILFSKKIKTKEDINNEGKSCTSFKNI